MKTSRGLAANGNAALTGIDASVYELQAAARLAVEACERLQDNIRALDVQMAMMDTHFRTYESDLSEIDRGLARQAALSGQLAGIMGN